MPIIVDINTKGKTVPDLKGFILSIRGDNIFSINLTKFLCSLFREMFFK